MKFSSVAITAYTATCAVGRGRDALLHALRERRGGLRHYKSRTGFESSNVEPKIDTWIGEVDGVDSIALPSPLARFDCRNNRLAWLGLQGDGFLSAA